MFSAIISVWLETARRLANIAPCAGHPVSQIETIASPAPTTPKATTARPRRSMSAARMNTAGLSLMAAATAISAPKAAGRPAASRSKAQRITKPTNMEGWLCISARKAGADNDSTATPQSAQSVQLVCAGLASRPASSTDTARSGTCSTSAAFIKLWIEANCVTGARSAAQSGG